MNPTTYTLTGTIDGTSILHGSRHHEIGAPYGVRVSFVDSGNPDRVGSMVLPFDRKASNPHGLCGAKVEVTLRVLTTTKKVVPWTPSEVPLGAWFRWRHLTNLPTWGMTGLGDGGLWLGGGTPQIPYSLLAKDYEVSTDGGKTWGPAGKVEEVYE